MMLPFVHDEEEEARRIAAMPLADQARIKRAKFRKKRDAEREMRSLENRRGRVNPARVPHHLARTNAFSATNKNLCDDKDFKKTYRLGNHSIVEVHGRELGTQHRDAVYALFRLKAREFTLTPDDGQAAPATPWGGDKVLQATTTWRDLLTSMQISAHANNLVSVLAALTEIRSVEFRVFSGSAKEYDAQVSNGRLAKGPGFSDNMINRIDWTGASLDDRVTITYGAWVRRMFEMKKLVSLDAETYFHLKSDYAKSFWPFIDSQNNDLQISETALAEIAGRDLASETTAQRSKFRERCRAAFADMVRAGGLKSFDEISTGHGKPRIFTYVHARMRMIEQQQELGLDPDNDPLDDLNPQRRFL